MFAGRAAFQVLPYILESTANKLTNVEKVEKFTIKKKLSNNVKGVENSRKPEKCMYIHEMSL